ncbi:MAG: DNA mismatch repair endonuclease MutL [Firmicutes bacterium]|nr:DNA mismatch repair endonuclease MutL [Bacillota bacterium]
MGRIQILPDEVAHKIAAGEVIERPASVVKELVENSIDANSTQITVEIKAGGIEFIRVEDNGDGIPYDDLELAFQPHATSKIQTADELFSLYTLGFRGEALPSIASVAHLELFSRPADQNHGYKAALTQNGPQIEPVGTPPGTAVEVRNLFYNVPARYKFLKTPAAERRRVIEVVTNLALAHPHIAFRLVTDGKTVLSTQGNGRLLDTILIIQGKNTAQELLEINSQFPWGTVQGYVGTPTLGKGNRRGQVFIMNGRVIQNTTIRAALEKAYQGMLPVRTYPTAVLVLDVNPKLVDCNVHPAKTEVRFADEQEIFRDVLSAVRSGVMRKNIAPSLEKKQVSSRPKPKPVVQAQLQWEPETWKFVDELLREYSPQQQTTSTNPYQTPIAPTLEEDQSSMVQDTDDVRRFLLSGRIIGQLHQSYILLEVPSGLWLLDQHIVHERILFEGLQEAFAHRTIHVQEILPELLEFSPKEAALVQDNLERLSSLGIELEEFGNNDFLLRAVPSLISHTKEGWKQDILRIIDGMGEVQDWHDKTAVTLACKGAVKAGEFLDERAIRALLKDLAETENPFTCPHGRPIIVRLENDELLRRFGRT